MTAPTDLSIRLDRVRECQVAFRSARDTTPTGLRMNPTSRLERYIPGESMLVEREILKRTQRLEVVKPRKISARAPKEIAKHGVRKNRKIVDAGPNAPQLKRLIQHPYAQELSRPRAGKGWRQPLNTKLQIVPFGEAVKTAFADCQRVRWPKATREHPGPMVRPRISADDFLQSGEEG